MPVEHTVSWHVTSDDILSYYCNETYTIELQKNGFNSLIVLSIRGPNRSGTDKIEFRVDWALEIAEAIKYLVASYEHNGPKK